MISAHTGNFIQGAMKLNIIMRSEKNKYGHDIMSSTVPNIKIRTFALIHWFLIYEDFCGT